MATCQRRNTRQRQVVLEELNERHDHPTAAMLYDRVKLRLPRISLGTVYRNLDILQETGQCVRLCGADAAESRFDGRMEPHLHFQCRACGDLQDLSTMLPVLDDCIGTHIEGHLIEGYNLILRGTCRGCRS